jgi:ketosteroid isomerase-like protein
MRLLLLAVVMAFGCAEKLPESHVLPVVEAERAFSQRSQERGRKAAFLDNLAADAVVFAPGPTPGRGYYEAQPDVAGKLTWKPGWAEVSRAGDLGYTTGLYTLARTDGIRFGHYAAVWRKQTDGRWKVVADGGNQHPPPLAVAEKFDYRPAPPGKAKPPRVEMEPERRRLLAAERILLAAWVSNGGLALLAHATDDVRFLPADAQPVVGRGALQSALAVSRAELVFVPAGGQIASSGDLGYTYGTATRKAGPTATAEVGGYLRVWRRSERGVWQVALELHAMPPK